MNKMPEPLLSPNAAAVAAPDLTYVVPLTPPLTPSPVCLWCSRPIVVDPEDPAVWGRADTGGTTCALSQDPESQHRPYRCLTREADGLCPEPGVYWASRSESPASSYVCAAHKPNRMP